MGFDIIGVEPKNKTGEYFRNSIGEWRPLWHCICNNTEELTEEFRFFGQYNEGILINGELHRAIIRTLQELLRSRSQVEAKRALEQSPYLEWNGRRQPTVEMSFPAVGEHHHFEWENVERFLRFCEANEGFSIH